MKYFAHESSYVDDGAEIGEGTKIWHFSHVCAGAKIGKNCSFGQNVYIAPGVVIGDNVRVQNGVSIYSGLVIEDYCFLGPHCVFTNDRYPRSAGVWKMEQTILKRGASVGANATVLCGLHLGEFSMVGCGSTVIKSVPPKTLVVGNPARMVKIFSDQELLEKFKETGIMI
jgi:UDP-2-acetamido-3-amino-2,3-dideoxy-glucuronate N-acetyltransferase